MPGRSSLPVIETPQTLTVISSEFLDIAAINDTAGVVAYTPGIELLGMGDGTQANLFARGFYGPLKTLTFGGGVVGRSEREVVSVRAYRLPSYTRLGIMLSYNITPELLLELNAQNVTNERIYTSEYGQPDLGIAYAYPSLIKGRISYRF